MFLRLQSSLGFNGIVELMRRDLADLRYNYFFPPENIRARGLESIPNNLYRDDGLKLWNIIYGSVLDSNRGNMSFPCFHYVDFQPELMYLHQVCDGHGGLLLPQRLWSHKRHRAAGVDQWDFHTLSLREQRHRYSKDDAPFIRVLSLIAVNIPINRFPRSLHHRWRPDQVFDYGDLHSLRSAFCCQQSTGRIATH